MAIEALSKLGGGEALRVLIGVLQTQTPCDYGGVRLAAARALMRQPLVLLFSAYRSQPSAEMINFVFLGQAMEDGVAWVFDEGRGQVRVYSDRWVEVLDCIPREVTALIKQFASVTNLLISKEGLPGALLEYMPEAEYSPEREVVLPLMRESSSAFFQTSSAASSASSSAASAVHKLPALKQRGVVTDEQMVAHNQPADEAEPAGGLQPS